MQQHEIGKQSSVVGSRARRIVDAALDSDVATANTNAKLREVLRSCGTQVPVTTSHRVLVRRTEVALIGRLGPQAGPRLLHELTA